MFYRNRFAQFFCCSKDSLDLLCWCLTGYLHNQCGSVTLWDRNILLLIAVTIRGWLQCTNPLKQLCFMSPRYFTLITWWKCSTLFFLLSCLWHRWKRYWLLLAQKTTAAIFYEKLRKIKAIFIRFLHSTIVDFQLSPLNVVKYKSYNIPKILYGESYDSCVCDRLVMFVCLQEWLWYFSLSPFPSNHNAPLLLPVNQSCDSWTPHKMMRKREKSVFRDT